MKRIVVFLFLFLLYSVPSFSQTLYTEEYQDSYIYAYIKRDDITDWYGQKLRNDYVSIRNLSSTPVKVILMQRVMLYYWDQYVRDEVREETVYLYANSSENVKHLLGRGYHKQSLKGDHTFVTAYKILSVTPLNLNNKPSGNAGNAGTIYYFPARTSFSRKTNDSSTTMVFYPDGTCTSDGYIMIEDWPMQGSAKGKYYFQGRTIYITWDGDVREAYEQKSDLNLYKNGKLEYYRIHD